MTTYFDKSRQRWRYSFELDGRRHSAYCVDPKTNLHALTKSEAKAIEIRVKAALIEDRPEQTLLSGKITFAEAMAAYIVQVENGASWKNQRLYARELLKFFGPDTLLASVTETRVWEYIKWARKQKIVVWVGGSLKPGSELPVGKSEEDLWRTTNKVRSDSTVNRYLDALRKALTIMSRQRNPVSGLPMLVAPPKVPKLKEPDALPRPISHEDLKALLDKAPDHLADAILLCVLMGFRQAEVLSLTVRHVDLQNRGVWLKGNETKGNRGEFVPANRLAMENLHRLVQQAYARKLEHLISYRKANTGPWRSIRNIDSAWYTLLDNCGMVGRYKFHGTKATFVTEIAKSSPASVTQQLARHKDYDTTRRYIKMSDELSWKAVDSLDFGLSPPKSTSSRTHKSHTGITLISPYVSNSLSQMVGTAGFEPTTLSPPD